MISNHYPATYGSAHSGLILLVFSLAAVLLRHWFNVRHEAGHNRWILPASLALFAGLILATLPRRDVEEAGTAPVSTAAIMPVIKQRCAVCHSAHPSLAGMSDPPFGLAFDNPGEVEAQAQKIAESAVTTQTMPLGNLTGMTADERALLGRWYAGRTKGESESEAHK